MGSAVAGWAGENWIDVRSTNVRQIMAKRLDFAKQRGCDGVEPDNVDGYTNKPGISFTASDQLAYNKFLASEAHTRNLSVALKNDLDQVAALVGDFDFAVNEQCFEYGECNMLAPFINQQKPVFNAEYSSQYKSNPSLVCPQSVTLQFSTLILPLNLNDTFRISCR